MGWDRGLVVCLETGRPVPGRPLIERRFRTCAFENAVWWIPDFQSRICACEGGVGVRRPAEARFSVGLAVGGGSHDPAVKFSLCSNESGSGLATWFFGPGGAGIRIVL